MQSGGWLDLGCATLALRWLGGPSQRARLVLDERMEAFRHACRWHGAPTLRATLEAVDDEWVAYDDPDGARAPIAARNAYGHWEASWCYYQFAQRDEGAHCRFADRDAGLEHALRAVAVFAMMPSIALFFHAATLVRDGEAVLFAGHPNAGKSTIAREGGADAVLSNEISILTKRDGAWWAVPSPFWGTGDPAEHAHRAVPLRAIAVLEQAVERTCWTPLAGAHAMAALAPHVGVQARAQWNADLLSSLEDLTMQIPVHRMAWRRGTDPFAEVPWKP